VLLDRRFWFSKVLLFRLSLVIDLGYKLLDFMLLLLLDFRLG
jgi:hypothetical protein